MDQSFVRSKTCLLINNQEIDGEWYSCTGNVYDVLWIFKHGVLITDGLNVKVCWKRTI